MNEKSDLVWISNFVNFNLSEIEEVKKKAVTNNKKKIFILKTKLEDPFKEQLRKKIINNLKQALKKELLLWEYDLEINEENKEEVIKKINKENLFFKNQFLDLELENTIKNLEIINVKHKTVDIKNKNWFLKETWKTQKIFSDLMEKLNDQ